jgi:hypothetical protein
MLTTFACTDAIDPQLQLRLFGCDQVSLERPMQPISQHKKPHNTAFEYPPIALLGVKFLGFLPRSAQRNGRMLTPAVTVLMLEGSLLTQTLR